MAALAELSYDLYVLREGGRESCDESFDENDKESHVANDVDEEDLKNEDDLKGEGQEMMDDDDDDGEGSEETM